MSRAERQPKPSITCKGSKTKNVVAFYLGNAGDDLQQPSVEERKPPRDVFRAFGIVWVVACQVSVFNLQQRRRQSKRKQAEWCRVGNWWVNVRPELMYFSGDPVHRWERGRAVHRRMTMSVVVDVRCHCVSFRSSLTRNFLDSFVDCFVLCVGSGRAWLGTVAKCGAEHLASTPSALGIIFDRADGRSDTTATSGFAIEE